MIRFSEYEDKAACIELLRQSHASAQFSFPFCEKSAGILFEHHHKLSNACIVILEKDGSVCGLLMATYSQHPFGAGLWARETVWYVSPEARGGTGIKMLAAYEEWAVGAGCAAISMATLANNDVSAIYQRRGYAQAETHFVKYL